MIEKSLRHLRLKLVIIKIFIIIDMVTNTSYNEKLNLFIAAASNYIKIWSSKNWEEIKKFQIENTGTSKYSHSFLEFVNIGIVDGKTLAIGGNSSLKIWDLEQGISKLQFKQHHKSI